MCNLSREQANYGFLCLCVRVPRASGKYCSKQRWSRGPEISWQNVSTWTGDQEELSRTRTRENNNSTCSSIERNQRYVVFDILESYRIELTKVSNRKVTTSQEMAAIPGKE